MTRENDNDRAIILPRRGKNDPRLGPDALMVMIGAELRRTAAKSGAERTALNDISIPELYVLNHAKNCNLALAGPFLGAPQAVMAMEKLLVLGARRIWGFGWCGSLHSDLRIGRFLIPTGGISEEGTSRHYPIGGNAPCFNRHLIARLKAALARRGLEYAEGPVWTTDAPYRETPAKVKDFQAQGVMAVEMEMTALMTLAIYRSVAMAALLVVSDELFAGTWKPGFSDTAFKRASQQAGEVLLELALGRDEVCFDEHSRRNLGR